MVACYVDQYIIYWMTVDIILYEYVFFFYTQ